jgi:hypothetical protein
MKDRNLRSRWIGILLQYEYRTYYLPYHMLHKYLPVVPVIYSAGTPGGVVASGSSLVLPRAAADTCGQYSTLRYARASIVRCAMRGQKRGAQKEGSLGLLVVR